MTPDKLRSEMARVRLSSADIADRLGIAVAQIWKWRNGSRPIPDRHLPVLRDLLAHPPPRSGPRPVPAIVKVLRARPSLSSRKREQSPNRPPRKPQPPPRVIDPAGLPPPRVPERTAGRVRLDEALTMLATQWGRIRAAQEPPPMKPAPATPRQPLREPSRESPAPPRRRGAAPAEEPQQCAWRQDGMPCLDWAQPGRPYCLGHLRRIAVGT